MFTWRETQNSAALCAKRERQELSMKELSTGSEYHCSGVRVLAGEEQCSFLQLDCTLGTRKQAICFIKCMEGLAAWEQRHTQEMLEKSSFRRAFAKWHCGPDLPSLWLFIRSKRCGEWRPPMPKVDRALLADLVVPFLLSLHTLIHTPIFPSLPSKRQLVIITMKLCA